jgi:uncharacterized protein YijF (DUF1287 family)
MRALRSIIPITLAFALAAVAFAASPPSAAQANDADDARATVVAFARAQIGKPYKYATTGMATYDCSGLVYRSFMATGLGDLIGNRNRSAANTYNWFANQGLVTSNPKPGDIVAWGNPVSHVGIYSGMKDGHPMSVSALTSGVKEHRVHGVTTKFRAYLRVPFEKSGAGAQGSTTPADQTTALPAPFKNTVRLFKGAHTFYWLNASGAIQQQQTINRKSAFNVAVDPAIKQLNGHRYAQIKSGKWSGWWRRVPDAGPSSGMQSYANARTLRLSSGDHLFKTFHANRSVIIRRHVRIGQLTNVAVDAQANFNGKRHFRIASGPLGGTWVVQSAKSSLAP